MDSADGSRLVAWADEMNAVHHRLRDALDVAREAAEAGLAPPPPERDQLLYCWGFCLALTDHHRGEDVVLFPALVAAHPQLESLLAGLRRDHSMIEHLLGAYQAALAEGDSAVLLRHLDGISAVMETHFRFEEKSLGTVLESLDLAASRHQALGPLAP